jgi:hypothetical protein
VRVRVRVRVRLKLGPAAARRLATVAASSTQRRSL